MQVKQRRIFSNEFKRNAVQTSLESPDTVNSIAKSLGIHPAVLSKWRCELTSAKQTSNPIKNEGPESSFAELEREVARLKKQLERAEMENDMLKKGEGLLRQSKRIKFEFIAKHHSAKRPIKWLCHLFEVSRSGYYKWLNSEPSERSVENRSLSDFLKATSDEQHCIPGYRKLWKLAIENSFVCSKAKVQRLLQAMGYRSRACKRSFGRAASKSNAISAFNLLNREFNVADPNRVWVSDITQVRCLDGWQYLCVVLDLYSRKVVGWGTSKINNADLVIKTLNRAWKIRKPDGNKLLFHSDQGTQYTAENTLLWHHKRNITVSMSRKGNCWDNACAESFFAQYKKEWMSNLGEISRQQMTTQSRLYIVNYYNSVRKHGTLDGVSPNVFELIN
ncbi:IS3 family transposase [Vibrio superstes]|uniref:IS3 family transposase n=1 Tax=Vibrio superstes TaxID=198815 RepID=UPI000E5BCE35|nr:IS3 family transposase [Vibrio superstes]